MLSNIRIVLVNTSHAGNIGAAARAMKNMGLKQLYLVEPLKFPHRNATIRAAGADDILQQAVVVKTLSEALVGCQRVYGTSARLRALAGSLIDPRACALEITSNLNYQSAIVFGRERAGLTNEELAICQKHVHIPTEEQFSSLNLAAAVQVLTYELRVAMMSSTRVVPLQTGEALASADQLDGFYQHLQQTMQDIGFLNPTQPKMLMQRLRRLYNRTQLEATELNILRGFLTTIEKYTRSE